MFKHNSSAITCFQTRIQIGEKVIFHYQTCQNETYDVLNLSEQLRNIFDQELCLKFLIGNFRHLRRLTHESEEVSNSARTLNTDASLTEDGQNFSVGEIMSRFSG